MSVGGWRVMVLTGSSGGMECSPRWGILPARAGLPSAGRGPGVIVGQARALQAINTV